MTCDDLPAFFPEHSGGQMDIDCSRNRQCVGLTHLRVTVLRLSIFLAFVTYACMTDLSYACPSPQITVYLQQLGFNPSSKDITSIANDNVNGITLKSLVSKRDEMGVKRFIATRNFIHKYLKNASTAFPPAALYDVQYLTAREQAFIMYQIQKEFGVPPKDRVSLK